MVSEQTLPASVTLSEAAVGQLANSSVGLITTSLKKSNSTAPVGVPGTETVTVNASSEAPLATQYGVVYDLRNASSEGPCKTLWQLVQLSPNLTTWAQAIEVRLVQCQVFDEP